VPAHCKAVSDTDRSSATESACYVYEVCRIGKYRLTEHCQPHVLEINGVDGPVNHVENLEPLSCQQSAWVVFASNTCVPCMNTTSPSSIARPSGELGPVNQYGCRRRTAYSGPPNMYQVPAPSAQSHAQAHGRTTHRWPRYLRRSSPHRLSCFLLTAATTVTTWRPEGREGRGHSVNKDCGIRKENRAHLRRRYRPMLVITPQIREILPLRSRQL
jgi:hypothetical protein